MNETGRVPALVEETDTEQLIIKAKVCGWPMGILTCREGVGRRGEATVRDSAFSTQVDRWSLEQFDQA